MKIRDNFRIIIDGYNLIFQCGIEGRSRNSLAMEKARLRLVSTLAARLTDVQRKDVAIVFDAKRLPIKEVSQVSLKDEMTIVFATEYADADTLIEEMIRKHSAPKNLVVVSSDHRLHKAAIRRKATPIDSDIWFDEVESEPSPQTGVAGLDDSLSPDETPEEKDLPDELTKIDWSKEFGFDE